MNSRSALRAPQPMRHDDDQLERLAERIDRLTDEVGKLRLEMTEEFGKVHLGTPDLRAEMIDRNTSLLKWLIGFFAAQTAALGSLLAFFR